MIRKWTRVNGKEITWRSERCRRLWQWLRPGEWRRWRRFRAGRCPAVGRRPVPFAGWTAPTSAAVGPRMSPLHRNRWRYHLHPTLFFGGNVQQRLPVSVNTKQPLYWLPRAVLIDKNMKRDWIYILSGHEFPCLSIQFGRTHWTRFSLNGNGGFPTMVI